MATTFKSSVTFRWIFLSFNLPRFSPFPYSYSKMFLSRKLLLPFFSLHLPLTIFHFLSCFLILSILSINAFFSLRCFILQNATFQSDDFLYLCLFLFSLYLFISVFILFLFYLYTSAVLLVFLVVFLTLTFISVLYQFFFRFVSFCLSFLDRARRG